MAKKITPPPTAIILSEDVELPPCLAFTAVPRRAKRWNGLTELKQHTFIANLASCGCVEMAAASVGSSGSAFYQLRKAEGAESFAAAWEVAIDMGARIVLDKLMEHAIHGTPERLLKDGEVILERRKYNTRAMMWIVQQRFPETYGGSLNVTGGRPASSMPDSIKKLKEQWRKDWEKEQRDEAYKLAEADDDVYARRVNAIRKGFKRALTQDPLRRAAWEILCGPTDWEDLGTTPDYPGLPKDCHTNHHRPDMIVLAAALDVDTPDWGLRNAMEEGAFGPERQAEALEARRVRERG